MTVCVCIASRGRPDSLGEAFAGFMKNATHPGTRIVAALDDDDPADYGGEFSCGGRAPRENSLGAKYNRAASYAPSGTSVFVLGMDDAYASNVGWDQNLLNAADQFGDGVGAIFFGPKHHDLFQLSEAVAVTKGWIDWNGFFCPPYFPFWWHDTWIDEMARMTGRYVWADVKWEHHGKSEQPGAHKTTRMRDVSWWARFFDATRQTRLDKAVEMIRALDNPEWLKAQLIQDIVPKANALWHRNSKVRDHGHQFEKAHGAESGADPGYDKIRAEAEAMLLNLSMKAA